MAKAHVRAHPGGIAAALEFYASSPTPNLLILENQARRTSSSINWGSWPMFAIQAPRSSSSDTSMTCFFTAS
jgi:hypothetical protein